MRFRQIFEHGMENPQTFFSTLLNLPKFIRLYWRLLGDSRVDFWPKFVLVAAIGYFLSPLDFVPELLFPIIGYADDVILFLGAARYFLRTVPSEILDEHVQKIEGRHTT